LSFDKTQQYSFFSLLLFIALLSGVVEWILETRIGCLVLDIFLFTPQTKTTNLCQRNRSSSTYLLTFPRSYLFTTWITKPKHPSFSIFLFQFCIKSIPLYPRCGTSRPNLESSLFVYKLLRSFLGAWFYIWCFSVRLGQGWIERAGQVFPSSFFLFLSSRNHKK